MREYDEVVNRIENARRFGSLPGVEITRRAMEQLGDPMRGLPYIHVAGTNGKGSVCAFLTSVLREAGVRVGTFTSPHLVDFEERICVDGKRIPKETVKRLGNLLLDKDFGVSLTMFDYALLMAVLYFREEKCEAAIMETGLGGRLDSTNALGTPEVIVITQIGMDHTAILGDTPEKIAAEKAGIIKPGCPVVLERTSGEQVRRVFREKVSQTPGASLIEISRKEEEEAAALRLRMRGSYQPGNAAAAWKAAEIWLRRHIGGKAQERERDIREICKRGLEAAFWPGRMQLLSERPFLLVDGAHNPQGVEALAQSLTDRWRGERFHFIMGVLADKDYGEMIRPLIPIAYDFVTVTPDSERALWAEELAQVIESQGVKAYAEASVEEALRKLPVSEKTVAFGSLYFIGELIRYRGLPDIF